MKRLWRFRAGVPSPAGETDPLYMTPDGVILFLHQPIEGDRRSRE